MKKDCVFVCIHGECEDGHKYAVKAQQMGASVIISDRSMNLDVPVILADDTKDALIYLVKRMYPEKKPELFAVTGTNGKTTTSYIISSILNAAGKKCAVVGTNGVSFMGVGDIRTAPTTPAITELYEILTDLRKKGAECAAIECSSHALEQRRTEGLGIKVGVFTNLTHDHLDYHKTMENYFLAKRKLFEVCEIPVINADDKYGQRLLGEFKNAVSYGIENKATVTAKNVSHDIEGSAFILCINKREEPVRMRLSGMFSVYNALAAAGAAYAAGLPYESIISGLKNTDSVSGRMERLSCKGVNVVIDYAHTPDGLLKVLTALKGVTKGRLICVFGCGGNRDKAKRPEMAKISTEIADISIITSDNPRYEKPNFIISDIIRGAVSDRYIAVENREEAIKTAIMLSKEGDTILLAGKGNEMYQVIGGKRVEFDERKLAREYIKQIKG